MSFFIVSDTHFFDKNILKHIKRGVYDKSSKKIVPFKDEYEMNLHLVDSWNKVVKKGDSVLHLGDFFVGCSEEQAKKIFNRLNGKITLICGNHDLEDKKTFSILKKLPFESIVKYPIVYGRYIFSHKPMSKTGNYINVHGHSHGKSSIGIDVSCDVTGLKPVSINSLHLKRSINIGAENYE